MPLTVADALAIYPFSQSRVVAGHKGLTRTVTAVNVMDAPDIVDWVKPGELLLTTAYAIRDRLDQGPAIISGLAAKGCAGFAIKLGRFLDTVPAAMTELADQEGFPVIALPFHHNLADHMNALFPWLLDAQAPEWVQWMRHSGVPSLLHKDMPLKTWFDQLTRMLPCPVRMEAFTGESALLDTGSGATTGEHFSVRFHDREFGVLYADGDDGALQGNPYAPLLQQAATLLAWRLNSEVEQLTDLIWEQIRRPHKREWAARELEARGWHLPSRYCLVLSWVGEPRDARAGTRALAPIADRVGLALIEQALRSHPGLKIFRGSHFRSEYELLSVFDLGREGVSGSDVGAILADVHRQVQSAVGRPVALVLSEQSESDLARLPAVFEETRAYGQSYPFMGNGGVAFRRPWNLADVFSGLPTEAQLALAHQTLGPLLKRDSYSQELYETLRVYLESDGQLGIAAKRLFVHRNTVTYRLEKISEILRCDLKRLDTLLLLRMAVHFWEGHHVKAGA